MLSGSEKEKLKGDTFLVVLGDSKLERQTTTVSLCFTRGNQLIYDSF